MHWQFSEGSLSLIMRSRNRENSTSRNVEGVKATMTELLKIQCNGQQFDRTVAKVQKSDVFHTDWLNHFIKATEIDRPLWSTDRHLVRQVVCDRNQQKCDWTQTGWGCRFYTSELKLDDHFISTKIYVHDVVPMQKLRYLNYFICRVSKHEGIQNIKHIFMFVFQKCHALILNVNQNHQSSAIKFLVTFSIS